MLRFQVLKNMTFVNDILIGLVFAVTLDVIALMSANVGSKMSLFQPCAYPAEEDWLPLCH